MSFSSFDSAVQRDFGYLEGAAHLHNRGFWIIIERLRNAALFSSEGFGSAACPSPVLAAIRPAVVLSLIKFA